LGYFNLKAATVASSFIIEITAGIFVHRLHLIMRCVPRLGVKFKKPILVHYLADSVSEQLPKNTPQF